MTEAYELVSDRGQFFDPVIGIDWLVPLLVVPFGAIAAIRPSTRVAMAG
ncbi:MAG: hypothetical protein H6852_06440 [Geminicoccaceae bacterium]|nr:hypothetical protein [Geminicoccaceae bacterium]